MRDLVATLGQASTCQDALRDVSRSPALRARFSLPKVLGLACCFYRFSGRDLLKTGCGASRSPDCASGTSEGGRLVPFQPCILKSKGVPDVRKRPNGKLPCREGRKEDSESQLEPSQEGND